jgi:hypothetical protein
VTFIVTNGIEYLYVNMTLIIIIIIMDLLMLVFSHDEYNIERKYMNWVHEE